MSSGRAWRFRMRCRICSIQAVPSRQGVRLPHDSLAKKRTRLWQAAMADVVRKPHFTPARKPAPPRRSRLAVLTGHRRGHFHSAAEGFVAAGGEVAAGIGDGEPLGDDRIC